MRKWRTLVMVILMLLVFVSVSFAANKDYGDFLALNQRSEAELISAGKTTKMKIGKNPITIINTDKGHVLLCGGNYSYDKSRQEVAILEEGSLSVYNSVKKEFDTKLTFKAALGWYLLDEANSVMWLVTLKGTYYSDDSHETGELQATLYRVNLDTFEKIELPLDNDLSEIELSADEKWLALAYPGLPETEDSIVSLVDTKTLKSISKYEVGKNPTLLRFNENNSALMIACDGDPKKARKTAGVWVVDLTKQAVVLQKSFGIAARSFLVAEGDQRFYAVVAANDPNKYRLIAFDMAGVLFETEIGFIPQSIQQRPESDQLFIVDEDQDVKKAFSSILVLNAKTGEVIKQMAFEYKLRPIIFIQNSPVAYVHGILKKERASQSLRYLLSIDLNKFELKEAIMTGPASKSAWLYLNEPISPMLYGGGSEIGKVIGKIKGLKQRISDILISNAQDKIYILDTVNCEIIVYDTVQQKTITRVAKFAHPFQRADAVGFMFSPNQKFIIVYNEIEIIIINTATYEIDYHRNVFISPYGGFTYTPRVIVPFFSPDGTKMLVENGSYDILVINMETGKKIDVIPAKISAKTILYWIQ